jgi:RNA polymerase sigma-70 factor, ECF subfamily
MPHIVRRDGPSDKTLLRRARQGDRQSFLALLHRYDPRLRRLALQLLADPTRVDRMLNRAYLKAWRSLPFLERTEAAAGWLYRVVYNVCLNELRWEPSRAAPAPPDGPPVPVPAAPVERRLAALRALPPAERIPLVLVDGEGFGLDAAARMMRRKPHQVALDLARARGLWRSFVTGEAEPPPEARPAEPAAVQRAAPALIAPSPAATLAKLAALATPTAPHEPGGHVKLLPPGPGGSTPPPVAAKRAVFRRGLSEATGSAAPQPEPAAAADGPPAASERPVIQRPAKSRARTDGHAAAASSASPSSPASPAPESAAGATRPARRPAKKRTPAASRGRPQRPITSVPAVETGRPDGEGDGEVPPPVAPAASDGAEPAEPRAEGVELEGNGSGPPAPAGGAGARRKRRRDAKRAVRPRTRGGPTPGAANTTGEIRLSADDTDPGRGSAAG